MNNYYIHHIPRRLRVRITALKANAKAAQELQVTMLELTGVTSVEINLLTGSVLVHYDGESSTRERLCDFIQRRAVIARRGSDSGETTELLLALRSGFTTGQHDRIAPVGWRESSGSRVQALIGRSDRSGHRNRSNRPPVISTRE